MQKRTCNAGVLCWLAYKGATEAACQVPGDYAVALEEGMQTRYKSYLLRVWQRRDATGCEWAGSLVQIEAGAEWRFNTLDQLLTHLRLLAEADARREAPDNAVAQPGLRDDTRRTE